MYDYGISNQPEVTTMLPLAYRLTSRDITTYCDADRMMLATDQDARDDILIVVDDNGRSFPAWAPY